jgi:glutaminyl-tRNA synthetase
MYTFAHPIEDALENITHSVCTLEFEDQRPFYDWLLEKLADLGLLARPLPKQYEFARLNVTYVITSKRKLKALVDDGTVDGWDDPRMPTLAGLRRRGYTPQALALFCERSGVTKSGGWIDYASLEAALRDDLEAKAPRAMAVLDPLLLVLTNWDKEIGAGQLLPCHAPRLPGAGADAPNTEPRRFSLGPRVWIERDDFTQTPAKGYHRLAPPRTDAQGQAIAGSTVRLKYGYVIECTGCSKDEAGRVTEVQARLLPDTRSGTPGADRVKVKGVVSWVGMHDAVQAEVRLYDRLFADREPDAGGKDFRTALNPKSKAVVTAYLEPSIASAQPQDAFQFERHGYFVADRMAHRTDSPVFNRTTTLKDSWGKA